MKKLTFKPLIFIALIAGGLLTEFLPSSHSDFAIAPAVLAALISAGGGITSNLLGNIGRGKRERKQQERLRKYASQDAENMQKIAADTLKSLGANTAEETGEFKGTLGKLSSLNELFNQQAGKSYLDTTEGKSFSSMIDERSRKNQMNLANTFNMSGGGTPEALLSGLGRINEQEGASLRDLVAGADQRRSQLRSGQMATLGQILSGQGNLISQKNNQASSALNFATGTYGNAQNSLANLQNQNMAQMNNVNQGFQNAAMLALMGGGGQKAASGGSTFLDMQKKFAA